MVAVVSCAAFLFAEPVETSSDRVRGKVTPKERNNRYPRKLPSKQGTKLCFFSLLPQRPSFVINKVAYSA